MYFFNFLFCALWSVLYNGRVKQSNMDYTWRTMWKVLKDKLRHWERLEKSIEPYSLNLNLNEGNPCRKIIIWNTVNSIAEHCTNKQWWKKKKMPIWYKKDWPALFWFCLEEHFTGLSLKATVGWRHHLSTHFLHLSLRFHFFVLCFTAQVENWVITSWRHCSKVNPLVPLLFSLPRPLLLLSLWGGPSYNTPGAAFHRQWEHLQRCRSRADHHPRLQAGLANAPVISCHRASTQDSGRNYNIVATESMRWQGKSNCGSREAKW